MKKNELLVIYGSEIQEMTKTLLRGGRVSELIPRRDALIGIKPNLLGPVSADQGATTHPEVVEGLIAYLREEGYDNLVCLESSWVGDRTADSLLVTGFGEMLSRLEVPFWDLQKDRGVSLDCGGMELQVCERALRIDFLINVPVLKGHCQTRMTCALKNMKGLIPGSEKRRFHRMGLHEPIGHLSAGLRQDLILVDSLCGDLTFEDGGNPVIQNRLILARDPVLCDAYGCELIGIPSDQVGYLTVAAGLGIGERDLAKARIRILGGEAPGKEEKGDWRRVMALAERVQEVDSCSACYASLIPALARLEKEGALTGLKDRICIGQGYRGRTGRLGIGSCTRLFGQHLEGCPPQENAVYQFLTEKIHEDSAKNEKNMKSEEKN